MEKQTNLLQRRKESLTDFVNEVETYVALLVARNQFPLIGGLLSFILSYITHNCSLQVVFIIQLRHVKDFRHLQLLCNSTLLVPIKIFHAYIYLHSKLLHFFLLNLYQINYIIPNRVITLAIILKSLDSYHGKQYT